MMRNLAQSKAAIAAVSVVVVASTAGAGWAASSALTTAGDPTLHGCAKRQGGDLRIVNDPTACVTAGSLSARERLVEWNKEGVEGPKGDRGRRGLRGAAGTPGVAGPGVRVLDANGESVGPLVDMVNSYAVRLLTDSGYLVQLNLNGKMDPTPISYTTADCTGTPYMGSWASGWPKTVYLDSASDRLMEVAPGEAQTVTIQSQSYGPASCQQPFMVPPTAFVLQEVAPSVVGLTTENNVPGPISLSPR
jgi:hypothetical protein